MVVWRAHLHNIKANEVQRAQAAHILQQFAAGEPAYFRCARAGCISRVSSVNIQRHINFALTHLRLHLCQHGLHAARLRLVGGDDARTEGAGIIVIAGAAGGAANANLHISCGIDQPFLQRVPERCAMAVWMAGEF